MKKIYISFLLGALGGVLQVHAGKTSFSFQAKGNTYSVASQKNFEKYILQPLRTKLKVQSSPVSKGIHFINHIRFILRSSRNVIPSCTVEIRFQAVWMPLKRSVFKGKATGFGRFSRTTTMDRKKKKRLCLTAFQAASKRFKAVVPNLVKQILRRNTKLSKKQILGQPFRGNLLGKTSNYSVNEKINIREMNWFLPPMP